MTQELLNLLSYFGGRPDAVAVRFLLAAFFWSVLALVSFREWQAARDRKDLFVCTAALIGLFRELLMFAAEYGGMRGLLSFDSLHRFYPPFEHAATMLSGIFISTAFINYLGKKQAPLSRRYFLTSVSVTLFLYVVTASLWPGYLAAHPGLEFGSFWGDMAYRVAACLVLGIAIAVFVLARIQGGRVQGALLTAILFLFLDEFLMIFNLATGERHVALFAPIRHNFHIWAIPLFVGVYWSDQNHRLRKALKDIRGERLRSEAIIAAIADAITIQDRNFRILFQNQPNKDMVGDHAGELCFKAYEKKDKRCDDCPVSRTFEDGKVHHVERTLMLNGSPRIFEITASPLRDSDGRIIAGIELVRDVTEKKRLQDEDVKSQKLESIGLLAGGLAHDFNNMLTTIYGNIGLAKLSIGDGHEASEQLEAAERAALRATGVTRQLLTFAKGGAPLKKVCSIADLVRESVAFTLSGSAVKAEFTMAGYICPVDVDPGQMSQVFNNLTLNAMQAMPNGGIIRIAIDTVRIPDPMPPLVPGEYARIVVSDTGIGIPEDLQIRIFDPYFTTKQKGNGLGLATVQEA